MILVEETTVPQSSLPVSQFKDHLRLGTGFANDADQDLVLESYLRAAIAAIEARTGKILIARAFSWTLTAWRDRQEQPLPVGTGQRGFFVTLIDQSGSEIAVAADSWVLLRDSQRPKLRAAIAALPLVPVNGSVRINLDAGYGLNWSNLPSDLAQAVLILAAHFYEYRHDLTHGAPALPAQVSALIERYRTVRLFLGGRS